VGPTFRFLLLVGSALLPGRTFAQDVPAPAPSSPPPAATAPGGPQSLGEDPAWQSIGGFNGPRGEGGIDLLQNEVFRESRNGDLFQDLGDLQFEVSKAWDVVDVGAQANFKRRVVERHQALAPGTEVGPGDLSYFQEINSALGKADLGVDYSQQHLDPLGVGFNAEAGFVVTVAQSKRPHPLGMTTSRRTHVGSVGDELREYWRSHGVRFDRHILKDVGRGFVDFLGLIGGQIGAHFEDTEVGAQYFEGFVEPLTIWTDLGVPLRPELFRGEESALRPGDAVSYLVFLEVAPLSAGLDRWGTQSNLKGFLRFLRETTIVREPDDQVLLRVKNIAAQGVETTPIKIRPELKWLFLHYGYTFLSDRLDQSVFRTSQIVYRIDLRNERAEQAFEYLLGTGHQVRFKPLLEAALDNDGVTILANDYVAGNRREHAFLARMPSWFRADRRNVAVVKHVETPSETYQEATHARYQNFRQSLGTDRSRSSRAVMTLETAHRPRTDEAQAPVAPADALTVSTQVRDKTADPRKLSYIVGLLRGVLGLDVPTPGFTDLRRSNAPQREGALLSLDVRLDAEQIERLQALDDDTVWRALAEFYLGPAMTDAWLTPRQRDLWRLSGPLRAKSGPAAAEIGPRVDAWLARHPEATGAGVLPDAANTSRRLFLRSEAFVRRLHALQAKSRAEAPCLACWANLYSDFQDATFLQLLLVRAAGGVGAAGAAYDAQIWTDSMFRPLHLSNAMSYATPAAVEPPMPVPTTSESNALTGKPASVSDASVQAADARAAVPDVDWIDSSDSRLRAGTMYLERGSAPGDAPLHLRLELYSDYRYAPDLRLRSELRRDRLRSDVPLHVDMLELPEPVPVRESPFMVAHYRYQLDVPLAVTPDRKHAYTLYLRVINADGLPVTEEESLRFRVPRPKPASKPAAAGPARP
jgi:hypothetical protein